MTRKVLISAVLALCSISMAGAQEYRALPIVTHDSMRLIVSPQMNFSTEWLQAEVNPIFRQRRELRKTMEQRNRESLLLRNKSGSHRDVNKEIGSWAISVGNTSIKNWSPYPDRMLDARTLRFPTRQPKNLKAPK